MENVGKLEIEELQNQITSLELKLSQKDEEFIILNLALKGLLDEKEKLLSLVFNEDSSRKKNLEIKLVELNRKASEKDRKLEENKFFDYINKNLLNNVLSYLDLNDLLHCRRINKVFNNLSQVLLIERIKIELKNKPQPFDYSSLAPILEAILNQLNCLNLSDITEIYSFKNPPNTLRIVLDMLALILIDKGGWAELRKKIGPRDLLNAIMLFDKDQILGKKYKISKMLADKNLNYERVLAISRAGGSFFRWIEGMGQFQNVYNDANEKGKSIYYQKLEQFLKKLE